MPLVINDPETIAALARLAAERGTTEEQVVRDLAVARVGICQGGEPPREDWEERLDFIRRIGMRAAAKVPEDRRFDDHGDLLYDASGLPK